MVQDFSHQQDEDFFQGWRSDHRNQPISKVHLLWSTKSTKKSSAEMVGPANEWIWSNYSDLTRPHPKWWFSKGKPLISGKSRLVKYYNLAGWMNEWILVVNMNEGFHRMHFEGRWEIFLWPRVAQWTTTLEETNAWGGGWRCISCWCRDRVPFVCSFFFFGCVTPLNKKRSFDEQTGSGCQNIVCTEMYSWNMCIYDIYIHIHTCI